MTGDDLIREIINLYKIAKTSTEKFKLTEIKRGRNHSISSQTEDLLAFFIIKRSLKKNFEVWVDYPISFKTNSKLTKKGNPGTKTIYPDISLVRKNEHGQNEIYEMIDLKMDLGWKRELKPYLDQKLGLVKEMRESKIATYKKVDDEGKKMSEKNEVLISKKVKWRVPVISDQNIDPIQMSENLKHSQGDKFEDFLKMYIFSSEFHPNSGKAKTNNKEIDSFVDDITHSI